MSKFTVQRITDHALLYDFLDRRQDAYMLGDLAEPYWSNAEFYGAFDGSLLRGVVLKYPPIDPPPMISSGDPEAVAAVYTHIAETTPRLFYHAADGHLAGILAHYIIRKNAHLAHWRMICEPNQFQPVVSDLPRRVTSADLDKLKNLIQPPESLLDSTPFYGIEQDGRFISIAGTHIVSPETGIGVVGWVFTNPEHRGKGYATLCTSAVSAEFFRMGLTTLALNVRQDNQPAIRAYQRIGFVINNPLWEGEAARK